MAKNVQKTISHCLKILCFVFEKSDSRRGANTTKGFDETEKRSKKIVKAFLKNVSITPNAHPNERL
jgi:hypothetical protein